MSDATRIFIVEDESRIARVLELELTYEGYQTDVAKDGLQAWEDLQSKQWDLILLDVMLPGLSGIEVLRRMRDRGDLTPVIMLTARDAIVDKVTGLDHGANDYVTKPFEIEELLARIRACLRQQKANRQVQTEEGKLTMADVVVDPGAREVVRAGQPIQLTQREFDLLVCLLNHANQVLSREQLLEQVWGFDFYGDTNIVDVYIRYLRQKLDKPFTNPLIQTVRGVGYMIKEKK